MNTLESEIRDTLQLVPNAALAAAVRGEIDLLAIARNEIMARGLGREGQWVGFDRARELHGSPLGGL